MNNIQLEMIYRYAGEMSYIAASYLNEKARSEGKADVVDMNMPSLPLNEVKWLIREYGFLETKTKFPRVYRNLTARFTSQKDFKSISFKDLDSVENWDAERAVKYFRRIKRERDARQMLAEGLQVADLEVGESGLARAGINKAQYDKWRVGSCYCPSEIIEAIYNAAPVDAFFVNRLAAIVSGLPSSKWTEKES